MSPRKDHKIPSVREITRHLVYLPKVLQLVWQVCKGWFLLWMICQVVLGFAPGLIAVLSRDLINTLADGLTHSQYDMPLLLQQGGFFLLVFVGNEVFSRLLTWSRLNQSERMRDHLTFLVHQQSIRLDMYYYDSPRYYDLLHRARVDAIDRPITILENLGNLVRYAITYLSLAGILAAYAFWLPLVIVAGALPSFFIIFYHTRKNYEWKRKNTSNERLQNYFDWIISLRDAAEELRLFNLGNYFQKSYRDLRTRLRGEYLLLQRNKLFGELLSVFLSLAVTGVVIVWVLLRMLGGKAGFGDLALFYQVFNQGQVIVRSSMSSASDFVGNLMFLQNLFEFLELEPKIIQDSTTNTEKLSEKIEYEFSAVSFSYPDSENLALKEFNLHIPASKITAIVGENGAGKSTLIKLMCRFYDPTMGKITINGRDISEFSPEEIYALTSILFQNPVRYHTTAYDNIHFGNLDLAGDEDEIKIAARLAGSHEVIKRLPQGYQTILGKWFGGAELSSGEWQRLALARAFLRKSPVIILDEPTSALDSWAEIDWFQRFRQLAEGRTSVIITHRFTTAMQADIIHVMKAGKIIESGNHESLLAQDGLYAMSWRAQMRKAGEF